MLTGSSLKLMMERFLKELSTWELPNNMQTVGLATQGMVPFCTIYSTFLQRAYDQVIHDVALQNLPVIFCLIFGLVGEEENAPRNFDLTYLRAIPNMTFLRRGMK